MTHLHNLLARTSSRTPPGRKTRPSAWLIALGSSAIVLTACGEGGGGNTNNSTGTETTTGGAEEALTMGVLLNWTYYAGDHGYITIAQDQGYFDEVNLTVDVQEGSGSGTTLQLVAAGTENVGLIDAGTMMTGVSQGMDVSSVMVINQLSPLAVIFPADKGYETWEDLRGASIMDTPGSANGATLPAALAASNMTMDDVEVIQTSNPSAKESAVLSGNADALLGFTNEQGVRLDLTQDGFDWVYYSDAGVNLLHMAVVVNNDWLNEGMNSEAISRFTRAMQRAIEFTQENPEEAATIFAEVHTDFTQELALAQITESLRLLHTENTEGQPVGWSHTDDWAASESLLVEYMDVTPAEDVSDYFTNEFVE